MNGHVDGTFGNLGVASIASGSAVAISVVGSSIYAVGKDDAVTPSKLRLARFWN